MQSIKLLQLGHLELAAFVNEELERNPLIERDDEQRAQDSDRTEENANNSEENHSLPDTLGSAEQIADSFDTDTDTENLFPEQVGQDSISQSINNYKSMGEVFNNSQGADIDSYTASKKTLSDHLLEQISLMFSDQLKLIISHQLVNNLDERGYLDSPCEEIATLLNIEEHEVISVLKELQSCEPLGVFARDLPECLAIQLKERDRLDPLMMKLLDNLHFIERHDFLTLEREIGASKEDISDMLSELRELDPKPALAFDGAPMQAIIADVFVRKSNDGSWLIELNSEILPRILINQNYYALVSKKLRNKQEKIFLSDCMQTANWLTKSLDQRAQTILKVATEIVRFQNGFFHHGVSRLKPMTLKMVADEIEMHESTVSRVTANKYISCERGLFEMKYFFTSALASNIGQAEHSAEAVRFSIKNLIKAESAKAILSDDKIGQMLQEELGVDIARRTVAKYRESMNIPSSIIRRRQKKLMQQT